jgi:hypothetical protein
VARPSELEEHQGVLRVEGSRCMQNPRRVFTLCRGTERVPLASRDAKSDRAR